MMPDKDIQIEPGACVSFEWEVSGTKDVYFQGNPVPLKNRVDECPKETTTFVLKVIEANGAVILRQVTVNIGTSSVTTEPAGGAQRSLVKLIDMNLSPDIAQKWDVSPDGLVWTFYLEKGVRFANGNPVTAGVFVELINKDAGLFKNISSVAMIDDYTLVVKFSDPNPDEIKKVLISTTMFVLP